MSEYKRYPNSFRLFEPNSEQLERAKQNDYEIAFTNKNVSIDIALESGEIVQGEFFLGVYRNRDGSMTAKLKQKNRQGASQQPANSPGMTAQQARATLMSPGQGGQKPMQGGNLGTGGMISDDIPFMPQRD